MDTIEASFADASGEVKTTTASKTWEGDEPIDTTPPTCVLQSITAGPPTTLTVFTQDTGSGLSTIEVLIDDNADVSIPSFTVGTTDPVIVTATKLDPSQQAQVELEVTDVAGNTTRCDPVIVNLEIPAQSSWGRASVTVPGIPALEDQVSIQNGTPGATLLRLSINQGATQALPLGDGTVRNLDLSAAITEADNSATLVMHGPPGSSILVMFHDGSATLPVSPSLSPQSVGERVNLNWGGY